jgi:chitin synthase
MLYFYMLLNFIFTLVLVGSLYATFSILIRSFFDDEECDAVSPARVFELVYLALLFVFVLMAITKPISKSGSIYTIYVIIFGVFIFASIGFSFVYFWENTTNIYVAGMLIFAMVGSYLLPPLLNFNRMSIWKYFCGTIIIAFLTPTYINIIIIYSMANLHDVSWGNRESGDGKSAEETKKNLEQFRALYLIVWVALNSIYGYGIIYITSDGQTYYILILVIMVAGQI